MREEDDVERSDGCDREKSNGHAGGAKGLRTVEERHVGGTLRGSRSARARRNEAEKGKEGQTE